MRVRHSPKDVNPACLEQIPQLVEMGNFMRDDFLMGQPFRIVIDLVNACLTSSTYIGFQVITYNY